MWYISCGAGTTRCFSMRYISCARLKNKTAFNGKIVSCIWGNTFSDFYSYSFAREYIILADITIASVPSVYRWKNKRRCGHSWNSLCSAARTALRCISAGFHKVAGEKMYMTTFLSTGLPMKSTLSLDIYVRRN